MMGIGEAEKQNCSSCSVLSADRIIQVRRFSDKTPEGTLNYRLGNFSGFRCVLVCGKLDHALRANREGLFEVSCY